MGQLPDSPNYLLLVYRLLWQAEQIDKCEFSPGVTVESYSILVDYNRMGFKLTDLDQLLGLLNYCGNRKGYMFRRGVCDLSRARLTVSRHLSTITEDSGIDEIAAKTSLSIEEAALVVYFLLSSLDSIADFPPDTDQHYWDLQVATGISKELLDRVHRDFTRMYEKTLDWWTKKKGVTLKFWRPFDDIGTTSYLAVTVYNTPPSY